MLGSSQAFLFVNFANLADLVRNLFSRSEGFREMRILKRFAKNTKFKKWLAAAPHRACIVNRKLVYEGKKMSHEFLRQEKLTIRKIRGCSRLLTQSLVRRNASNISSSGVTAAIARHPSVTDSLTDVW
jgi:hypothetical protein